MQTCYIVGAAPFADTFTPDEDDLVIAADGGYLSLKEKGIRTDLVVGDFDSSPAPADLPLIRHPVEKDDTDTALALKEGMKRGYQVFVFYGCLGGRFDHSIAAVQTLYHLAREGMFGYLCGDGTVSTVVVDRTLRFSPKGTVSVFSLTDESLGVTLRGMKYPLENARLTNDIPLGVSNEADGTGAEVTVTRGALYVVWKKE